MKFTPLDIPGAWQVDAEPVADGRGSFARLWCRDEFARAGIAFDAVQASASFNHRAGTLRGLHFAWPPSGESKFVRVVRGSVVDILLDLRPASPAYRRHVAVRLDAGDGRALLVPPGVAHGFQTLVDATEIHYLMNEAYRADLADGVRFDDAAFGIRWPLPVAAIAERDRTYVDFDADAHAARHAAAAAGAR